MIYLKTSIGIEIRDEDLLISSLRSNFSAGVFTSFKRIQGYRQRDREEVKGELDLFLKGEQLGRENIVLGLPSRDVIVRHLDFPKEVEDNLKQVVLYQVQSLEPSEEEQFYYDFLQVKNGDGGKRLNVLVAMVKKSTLDGHLDVLRELGIRPSAVTVGSIALANVFLGTCGEEAAKTYIILDFKASTVETLLLRNGALVFAHEAPRTQEGELREVVLGELETAVSKVRLDPEESVESLILSGEAPETFCQELSRDLQECERIEKRIRFEIPPRVGNRVAEAVTSLGLAYSGIVRRPPMKLNMLPARLRIRQTRWAYVPAIVLGLLCLVLLTALGFRQMIQEQILIRELDQEIAALNPRIERVQAIKSRAEGLEKNILFLEGLVRDQDRNLEILRELTEILPQDTYLTMFKNSDCSIQIVGLSQSAPDLLPKLEESPLFLDVVQRGTIFKDTQTGKDRFTFDMRCER